MKIIFKITRERFVESQNKTGPLLNPPQVYILSARHAGYTPRVNSTPPSARCQSEAGKSKLGPLPRDSAVSVNSV